VVIAVVSVVVSVVVVVVSFVVPGTKLTLCVRSLFASETFDFRKCISIVMVLVVELRVVVIVMAITFAAVIAFVWGKS
jgi:hypothetical protein